MAESISKCNIKKVYMRAKNNLSGIGENAPVPKIFATFET